MLFLFYCHAIFQDSSQCCRRKQSKRWYQKYDEPNVQISWDLISTFATKVPGVAVHVLHGKPQPVLDASHRLLARKCQLDMCVGLNRAKHTPAAYLES